MKFLNPSDTPALSSATFEVLNSASQSAVFSVEPAQASQVEGQSGTTPFTFTVTRTGDTGSAAQRVLVGDGQRGQPGVGFGLRGQRAAERDGELRGGRDVEDDHGQRRGRHGGGVQRRASQ